ncbi:MAG: alpha-glucosidase [Candidatus Delongbacteria bacterium]|nr:alpha-glucosidase [Candidatus Delongbacteria bacterium]
MTFKNFGKYANCWWKYGVIYHIYVLSFKDSNGDGYGDIRGIIEKLDHIIDLGITAIWLSPVFKSPMSDFGYDIDDYYSIDPVFGKMRDIEELILRCHEKNIFIIFDMVMNHTSVKHKWFTESKKSLNSDKRDWYIWKSGKNGKPPNNWKTIYGKTAWEYDNNTDQYYYHSFLKEQPDLNWRNPEVKKEFGKIFRFWLDKGIDGFRLDAVNFIIKDIKLRENPGLFEIILGKRKFYSRNRSSSLKLLQHFRKIINSYDNRMLIGEIFALPPGESDVVSYYMSEGDDTLNMAFDFSLLFQKWSASSYFKAIIRSYISMPSKGWPSIVFSNHDLNRNISYDDQKARIKLILMLTLKGTPFIYYGEEIGMRNGIIRKNEIKDPMGKIYWPIYKGRDKARTPMQWDDSENSGFSTAAPWLPINKNFENNNISDERSKKNSLFTLTKKLIKLRNSYSSLHKGDWIPLIKGEKGIIAYLRTYGTERTLVVLNFSNTNKKLMHFNKMECVLLLSTGTKKRHKLQFLKNFVIEPYEGLIFLLKKEKYY